MWAFFLASFSRFPNALRSHLQHSFAARDNNVDGVDISRGEERTIELNINDIKLDCVCI